MGTSGETQERVSDALAEWIRERADRSGMSWAELSRRAGAKSSGWLSAVIKRRVGARPAYLAEFCRSIGVSPLEAFVVASWLRPEEVEGRISPEDVARDDFERDLLRYARALRTRNTDLAEVLLAAWRAAAQHSPEAA